MSMNLAEIAAPAHTAIVTQELQGAVVGPNAGLAVLAERRAAKRCPTSNGSCPPHARRA